MPSWSPRFSVPRSRLYPLSHFLVGVLSCTMLRCLVRLRSPALLIACTPEGIRWAVASAWVRLYPLFLVGCCFELYDAAVSSAPVLDLSADCVQTPLCIRFAVFFFFFAKLCISHRQSNGLVDEETGKSMLLMGIVWHVCTGVWGSANIAGSLPTTHCLDQTPRVG